MKRVPQLVQRGKKDRRLGEPSELDREAIEALNAEARIELIQALIPVALAEVGRTLGEEVDGLAGQRHARKSEGESYYRHGSNPGSVRLGGQRHPVRVPRVRGPEGEVRLESYERLHGASGGVNEGLYRKVLLGRRVQHEMHIVIRKLALVGSTQAGYLYPGNVCGIINAGVLDHNSHLGLT